MLHQQSWPCMAPCLSAVYVDFVFNAYYLCSSRCPSHNINHMQRFSVARPHSELGSHARTDGFSSLFPFSAAHILTPECRIVCTHTKHRWAVAGPITTTFAHHATAQNGILLNETKICVCVCVCTNIVCARARARL